MKNILIITLILLTFCSRGWDVKQGQIWIYEHNLDNPYEVSERDTIYIIDRIGEYVQYRKRVKYIVIKLIG